MINKNTTYIANIEFLNNKDFFDCAYDLLSKERRAKIDKFHFFKDKCHCAMSELLLYKALNMKNISKNEIKISHNEYLKPYIKNFDNIYFNVSHSGQYVICSLSQQEIGCDIELTDKANLKLAKRFFFKNEYETILNKNNLEEQNELFFRFWTLKESFVKNLGTGLNLPFKNFQIIIDENEIKIIQNVNDKKYYFKEYNISGYKCAVCALNDEFNNELIYIPQNELLSIF